MKNSFLVRSIRNAAATLFVIAVGINTAFADVPANDNFANAEILTGVRVSVVRSNVDATKEEGEPNHALNVGGRSVWFKWTAPMSTTVHFSTNRSDGNLDTLLHFYTGSEVNALISRGANNNIASPTNVKSFIRGTVSAGTTYYIVVDGANDGQAAAAGEFRLDIIPANPYQGADWDTDGITDIAVYRPDTSIWYTLRSSTGSLTARKWGTTGDIPVVTSRSTTGAEPHVFRPSDGSWYRQACCGYLVDFWGAPGDIPVPETYGGEQAATYAVFRPSEGKWYIYGHGSEFSPTYTFGVEGDIPLPGRYSPDGVADLTVFRPSTGVWYTLKRVNGHVSNDTFEAVQFGLPGDKPVPGDYDGDGILDRAIYRPSTGYFWVLRSTDNQQHALRWGAEDDIPVTGDFDGDGLFDFAVFRPSTGDWYIYQTSNQQARIERFGTTGDLPVTSNTR